MEMNLGAPVVAPMFPGRLGRTCGGAQVSGSCVLVLYGILFT